MRAPTRHRRRSIRQAGDKAEGPEGPVGKLKSMFFRFDLI